MLIMSLYSYLITRWLFDKVSVLIFCPGFNWMVFFLPAEFREFTVFRIQSFDENVFTNISGHSVVYFFPSLNSVFYRANIFNFDEI